MNRKELALEMFTKTNCAQSTLVALAGDQVDPNILQLVGSSFGGGIAQQGKTCGAVSGALMALGIKKGYTENASIEIKSEFYKKANCFINEFKADFGSDQCNELIKCDISDPKQKEKAKVEGVFINICPKFVAAAVHIMDKLIHNKLD